MRKHHLTGGDGEVAVHVADAADGAVGAVAAVGAMCAAAAAAAATFEPTFALLAQVEVIG